ncbi:four helix bundle protein [Mesorhizobium sp. WSM4307]|uniref:four helix bundle protein n=1 Tax=unclassified Mesorhizobium TaxID=325217 RepID=UPI000BAE943C|nr:MULTISPECIES: four helix bundle protein [unclassified Mesorhizobium]PBB25755.1 diversity-generating retroelement protein bAvd family protein [Mesorhizobium sp. WSM4304]PBB73528.1 diversity-generating retroelement protein bAvd family protein [Mesorhizobium sp. WSM4308]TRC79053.1 four helix bundle protein [Mesorhizobium sp. WSM4315]TRC85681.1 four helix bundle protein [Mesorhizobium sp. WSM4307]
MTGKINSYKDLIVWQQAMDLAVATYSLTKTWPKEEMYGLTSQIRRSATSIPANIAEGYGRDNRGSYQQFLGIAQGSLKEFETHLQIAERIGLATHDQAHQMLLATEGLGKMLRQLIIKLAPE